MWCVAQRLLGLTLGAKVGRSTWVLRRGACTLSALGQLHLREAASRPRLIHAHMRVLPALPATGPYHAGGGRQRHPLAAERPLPQGVARCCRWEGVGRSTNGVLRRFLSVAERWMEGEGAAHSAARPRTNTQLEKAANLPDLHSHSHSHRRWRWTSPRCGSTPCRRGCCTRACRCATLTTTTRPPCYQRLCAWCVCGRPGRHSSGVGPVAAPSKRGLCHELLPSRHAAVAWQPQHALCSPCKKFWRGWLWAACQLAGLNECTRSHTHATCHT